MDGCVTELELTTCGQDVAWMPAAARRNLFYGEAIDSLYTLDNLYRVRSNQIGVRMKGYRPGNAPPANDRRHFADTLWAEQDLFAATVVVHRPRKRLLVLGRLYRGRYCRLEREELTIPLPNVAGDGLLRVFLKGAGPGRTPGEGVDQWSAPWRGVLERSDGLRTAIPRDGRQLQSGDNPLEVRALGDTDNMFYLDRIEVNYRRWARAVGDRLSLNAEVDRPPRRGGIQRGGHHVFDITDPKTCPRHRDSRDRPRRGGTKRTFNAKQGRAT